MRNTKKRFSRRKKHNRKNTRHINKGGYFTGENLSQLMQQTETAEAEQKKYDIEKYGDRYTFVDKPVINIQSNKSGFSLAKCYFVKSKEQDKFFVIFDFNYDGIAGFLKKHLTRLGAALSLNKPIQEYIIEKNDGFYDADTSIQKGGSNNPFLLYMQVFLAPFIAIGIILSPVIVATAPLWIIPLYNTSSDFERFVDETIEKMSSTKISKDGTKITKNGFGYITKKILPDGTIVRNDKWGKLVEKVFPDGSIAKNDYFGEVKYNKDGTITTSLPNGKSITLTKEQFDKLDTFKTKLIQGINSVCFVFDIDPVTGIMKNNIGKGNAMGESYTNDHQIYDKINYLDEAQKDTDGFFKLNYNVFYEHFHDKYPYLPYFPTNEKEAQQLNIDKESCMNKAKKHCEKHYGQNKKKTDECIKRHTSYKIAVLHCKKHHHHEKTVKKCIKNHTKNQIHVTECSPVPVYDEKKDVDEEEVPVE